MPLEQRPREGGRPRDVDQQTPKKLRASDIGDSDSYKFADIPSCSVLETWLMRAERNQFNPLSSPVDGDTEAQKRARIDASRPALRQQSWAQDSGLLLPHHNHFPPVIRAVSIHWLVSLEVKTQLLTAAYKAQHGSASQSQPNLLVFLVFKSTMPLISLLKALLSAPKSPLSPPPG